MGLGALIKAGSDLFLTGDAFSPLTASSSAFVTLTSFSESSTSLRLRPDSIFTTDCECGSVLEGGGCSMVTTTVGGGEGRGAVTALSLTTFVVVVVVLLPGTFPFSSVTVDFFTLMVIVFMFMAPDAGLIGVVEDLAAGRDEVLPERFAGPALFRLLGRWFWDVCGEVLALLTRGDGADDEVVGVAPDFAAVLEEDGEGVFFNGVLFAEGELTPLSTLRLTEDLCGATEGGWKTSRDDGAAGCVGESGTDVLLPTVLIGGGVAPGMRIGGGGGACRE